MSTLTWFGHNCWSLETLGKHVLVDPFLDDSPTAPIKSAQAKADYVLVSHGHYDHVADAAKIAKRTGATAVSNFEICQWLSQQGVKHTEAMNLGGSIALSFGRVKLTVAHHSSVLPDGTPGGNPGGFLFTLSDAVVYFACDTALFGDMALYARGENGKGIDLAVLPIGDRFTMGPADSIKAIELIQPHRVLPTHYNTWPPIAQDAAAWAARVRSETSAEPLVLKPGESVTI
ncbi:MAG: metal-dependent hydrolase [Planctomycetota bacterium]|nr:MAG: metal-dependent hydrolase [Planctomycetota bacterium]